MSVMRVCKGCGALKPRDEMIKITKEYKSGKVILNPNSKIFGRSAYLCYNQKCIETALKKGKLNKALKGVSDDLKGLLNGQHKSQ